MLSCSGTRHPLLTRRIWFSYVVSVLLIYRTLVCTIVRALLSWVRLSRKGCHGRGRGPTERCTRVANTGQGSGCVAVGGVFPHGADRATGGRPHRGAPDHCVSPADHACTVPLAG